MGHLQRMENKGVRKGAWTEEEDILLRKCIDKYGEGNWRLVPVRAGLRRCRKSCRLRWLNYLHPNIKRGEFEEDEVDLIIRLHKLLGNRWSLIAGRIPGRTANDIKNYWNSHLKKKVGRETNLEKSRTEKTKTKVIKPQARTFSSSSKWLNGFGSSTDVQPQPIFSSATLPAAQEDSISWWKRVLADEEEEENGTINLSSGVGQELPERFGVEEEERMGKGGGAMMEVGEWDDIELDLGIWGLLGTLSLML